MSERQTQANRILALLQAHKGEWVGLPKIQLLFIASHTRRIHELRADGWIIELQDTWVGRERHTSYRLRGHIKDLATPMFDAAVAWDKAACEATDKA